MINPSDAVSFFVGLASVSAMVIALVFAIFTIISTSSSKQSGYLDLRVITSNNFPIAALCSVILPLLCVILIGALQYCNFALLERYYWMVFVVEFIVLVVVFVSLWKFTSRVYYLALESEFISDSLKKSLVVHDIPKGDSFIYIDEREFNISKIQRKLYSKRMSVGFEEITKKHLEEYPDCFDNPIFDGPESDDPYLNGPDVKDRKKRYLKKDLKKMGLYPWFQAPYQVAMISIDILCKCKGGNAKLALNYAIAVAQVHRYSREEHKTKEIIRILNAKQHNAEGDSYLDTVLGILIYEKYKENKQRPELLRYTVRLFEEAIKYDVDNETAKRNLNCLENEYPELMETFKAKNGST